MRALLRAGRDTAVSVRQLLRRAAPPRPSALRRGPAALALVALAGLVAETQGTQDAVANGDTRSLSIIHEHTKESATITFKRDGRFDSAALQQLNWLLRDWRIDEPTKMDPRLFDVVWEAHRAVGSQEPIHVVSAYRSPGTNAALRRRSKMVAEHSQHMLGKAMDFYLPDVSIDQIRAVGMHMQRGGVGWYPRSGSPFVHLDVGSVRSWPRMGYDQLARLFPDGKTVHMPASGGPMPGYEQAKAEILARGGSVAGYTQFASAEETGGGGKSLWQMLFGGGDDEDSSYYGLNNGGPKPTRAAPAAPTRVASAAMGEDAGTRTAMAYAARPDAADPLRSSLFRSSTAARTVPLRGAAAPEAAAPGQIAAMPAQQAAPAPALAPAPTPAPVPTPAAAPAVVQALAMPLPPRRPDALAVFAAAHGISADPAVPLPPSRRQMLASADGTIMPAALPPASAPATAPAFAAAPAIAPARPRPEADLSDPRVHLRALFAAAAAASAPPRSATIRVAAARPADTGALPEGLLSASTLDSGTRFGRRSPDEELSASRFSGPAVRAAVGP